MGGLKTSRIGTFAQINPTVDKNSQIFICDASDKPQGGVYLAVYKGLKGRAPSVMLHLTHRQAEIFAKAIVDMNAEEKAEEENS